MISTPPPTPAHPFQTFCEMAQKQNAYAELNIYANPLLTPQDIEEAHQECLDDSEWLREYMCQFVVDKNRAIIPEWTEDLAVEVPRPVKYFEYLHKYVSMDLGVKIDLTALLFGYYDPKTRELVIEDEADINGPDMTTLGLKDLVVTKEKLLWPNDRPHKRISDNDNPLLLQDLSSLHGVHFTSTGKDELKAMVNEVRIFVKAKRLKVNPKCKKLLGCLRYGIWNFKRKAFDRSNLYGHFDHLASLVYLIRNLDQNTDPVPEIMNPNPATMHLRETRKRAKLEDKIKKLLNI